MPLEMPNSMSECIYFTNRKLGEKGNAICWVAKQDCPKCKKAKMGKPVEGGKVKIRAKEYVCPACNYTAEKNAYEETLTACIQYTCPSCQKSAEAQIPFKRKKVEGVDTLRTKCQFCQANIDITKKMKEIKKKSKGPVEDDDAGMEE